MVDPQESRFWKAALQSELIDTDGLKACWDAIPPEKRVGDQVQIDRRIARQAVHAGLLTLWQAQQLLAGRSTGFKINRYTLIDLIGQGGMGRVYLAKDTRLGRRVALKILSPERVNNPRAIARFQREARVGAQLQHENLVRIYDEGEANGKCYLVMEFIEGKNIGTLIADNGPMPPGIAARLVRQVALGLEHAQQKGLIHRDVNPYNILVTTDGVAKLTDLGLAIDLADSEPVTRDGATVGTFDYVSPEQARHSHSVDTRSDIYSLGCTLYHMLAARVPYPSPSLPEKLFGHQALEPESLAGLVPGIPDELIEIVRKMMRKIPGERYQSPKDVAQALEPFVDVLDATTSSSSSRDDAINSRHVSAQAETQVVPRIEPTPPTTPGSGGLELGINFGEAPSEPAEAGINLGIALDAGNAPEAPAAKAPAPPPPAPSPAAPPAPKPAPAKAAPPPKPAPVEAPTLAPDFAINLGGESPESNGVNLGLNLDPSPAPAAPPAPKPKPAAAKAPAPPPAKPVAPTPPAVASEPMPDLSFLGGDQADEASEEIGLGLGLDLGSPAPLAPGKPQPKPAPPKPAPPPVEEEEEDDDEEDEPKARSPRKPDRRILIGAAVGSVLVLLIVGAVVAMGLLGGKPSKSDKPTIAKKPAGKPAQTEKVVADPEPPPTKVTKNDEPGEPSAPPKAPEKAKKSVFNEPPIPKGQGFAVRTPDGQVSKEPTFKSAMQRAIGSRGRVVLNNAEPLKLTGEDAAINIHGGLLVIAAEPGTQPVLEVEVKASTPWLMIRTDTPLKLSGVTIVATFADKSSAPVIYSGSKVSLDRCVFRAKGAVAGSRLVQAEGEGLDATGCFFENFDHALEFTAFSSKIAVVKQCMMVRPKATAQSLGWALRVKNVPGGSGKSKRKVIMDRCTVKGKGLLELADFSSQYPCDVEVKDCAVLADSLLAWEHANPGDAPPSPEALHWSGGGSRYDVTSKAWVVLKADGSEPLPNGPSDIDSWNRDFHDRADKGPVKFQTEIADLPPEGSGPSDFAIPDQGTLKVGADPDLVGPLAKPAK